MLFMVHLYIRRKYPSVFPKKHGRESLFEVEVKGVELDLILYMRKLVLANVPIEGWVIDSYEHGLLDGSVTGM